MRRNSTFNSYQQVGTSQAYSFYCFCRLYIPRFGMSPNYQMESYKCLSVSFFLPFPVYSVYTSRVYLYRYLCLQVPDSLHQGYIFLSKLYQTLLRVPKPFPEIYLLTFSEKNFLCREKIKTDDSARSSFFIITRFYTLTNKLTITCVTIDRYTFSRFLRYRPISDGIGRKLSKLPAIVSVYMVIKNKVGYK